MECLGEERILARVEGRASTAEVERQDAHVAECSRCREVLAEAVRNVTKPVRPAELPSCEPGDTIGRYVLGRKLGAGGMGTVYAAFDSELERTVAIKTLRLSTPAAQAEELLHEARAMARVRSDHVVDVYEVLRKDSDLFLIMEMVEGTSLSRWLKERRPGWRDALELLLQAGRGLADAHACGVVHRDFKPLNVLVRDPDALHPAALVTDFGLSTLSNDPEHTLDDLATSTGGQPRDHASTIRGTPRYMAPELIARAAVGPPADQFAFCVSVYQALWRKHPFGVRTIDGLRRAFQRGPALAPPKRGPNAHVWPALRRGLSRDPGDRWPTMNALCDALEASMRPSRRHVAAVAGATFGCTLAAVAFAGERTRPCHDVAAPMQTRWDADARAQVLSSVDVTTPLGSEAGESFVEALDAYAAEWSERRIGVCESADELSEPIRVAQQQCLQQALAATDATIRTVVSGRAGAEKLADIAAELPSLERCDVEAVATQPVGDPAVALQIEDLLWTARSLRTAGALVDALTAARSAVEFAHAHGHEDAEARGLLLRGLLESPLEGTEPARASLLQALLLFRGLDDDAAIVRVEARLSVLSSGVEQTAWSEAAVKDAANTTDVEARALAFDSAGLAAYEAGDTTTAERHFTRALEELADGPLATRARILRHLGHVNEERGEVDAATTRFEQAIGLHTEHYGPHHPRVVLDVLSLVDLLIYESRLAEASTRLEGVLEISRRNAHPPRVLADVLVTSGDLETRLGDLERAEALLSEAVELGEEHPEIKRRIHSDALLMLSQVHQLQKDPDSSRALRERAIEVLRDDRGPDDPLTASAEVALGWTLRELDRYDEAEALASHALEVFEQHDSYTRMLPWTHDLLGVLARETGDARAAIDHHRVAHEFLIDLAGGPGVREFQTLLFKARAERAAGEHVAASETLRLAVEIREEHPDDVEPHLKRELDDLLQSDNAR